MNVAFQLSVFKWIFHSLCVCVWVLCVSRCSFSSLSNAEGCTSCDGCVSITPRVLFSHQSLRSWNRRSLYYAERAGQGRPLELWRYITALFFCTSCYKPLFHWYLYFSIPLGEWSSKQVNFIYIELWTIEIFQSSLTVLNRKITESVMWTSANIRQIQILL